MVRRNPIVGTYTFYNDATKMWDCGHCDYSTDSRASLVAHIESRHEQIDIECRLCGVQLRSHVSLNGHILNNCKGPKSRPPRPSRPTDGKTNSSSAA